MSAFLKLRTLAMIGATLEFYDFVIFIFFAPWIANAFFPEGSHFSGIMPVLLLFSVGHFARPLGGFLFSHIGDRYGRRRVFLWTISLMSFSTLGIGILPGYETLGDYVAILLLILRLIQGFSLGGELPGSMVFVSEHVDKKIRGSAAGLIIFGFSCGNLLGSLVGLLLNIYLPESELTSWGWRIPFILGSSLGFISYKIRQTTMETPMFQQTQKNNQIEKIPLLTVIKKYPGKVIIGMSLAITPAISIATFLFLPRYFFQYLEHNNFSNFSISTSIFLIMCITIIPCSFLSNKYGRKYFLITACTLLLICNTLAFYLIQNTTIHDLFFLFLLGIPVGMVVSTYETILIEIFPTNLRNTGVALCHNTSFAIFGGTMPSIYEYFCEHGYLFVLPLSLSISSILTIIAVFFMQDNSQYNLDQIV